MVPLPPLDSPKTLLCAATPFGRAAKRGLRGLGSVRLSAYMWLSCPEFSLRKAPRITVRGQTVQGGSSPLRKALLRSMVYSWSTRCPCGPLAFRRATEGSRVLRKVWGVKRGKKTLVVFPLLPPPPGGGTPHAMSWRIPPGPGGPFSPAAASRRNGGTVYPLLPGGSLRGRCPREGLLATYLKFRLSRTRFYKTIQKSRSRPRAAHGLQMNACEKRANVL